MTANITSWAFQTYMAQLEFMVVAFQPVPLALLGAFIAEGDTSFVNGGAFDSTINDISPFQRLSAKHSSDFSELLKAREIRMGKVTVSDVESSEGSKK